MRAIILFLVAFICGPALAQSDPVSVADGNVRIRAYLDPDEGIDVGQLVRLWVEVSSSTRFSEAPVYPDLRLDGAIVIMPDQFGVNFQDNTDGEARVGQRQRYAIIPQREGSFVVPPLKVKLSVMIGDNVSKPVVAQSGRIELIATYPAGTRGLEHILTTEELSIKQSYDSDGEGLKVGDAVTRTIELHGKNTFALALPKVEFEPVAGTRVYPAQPKLEDRTNRGQYSGSRVDAATYVLEKAGDIALPQITLRWWNPATETLEENELPPLEFEVEANPEFEHPAGQTAEKPGITQALIRRSVEMYYWLQANIAWLTLTAIGLWIVLLLWRRHAANAIIWWQERQRRAKASEAFHFKQFRRACSSNNRKEISSTFWRWVDSTSTGTVELNLPGTESGSDMENQSSCLSSLMRTYYGIDQKENVDGRKFYQIVKRYRRKLMKHQETIPTTENVRLNPVGS